MCARVIRSEARHLEGVNGSDDEITVYPQTGGADYVLVMDGPGGLETCIQFDHVDIQRNTVEFVRQRNRHHVTTGSIGADEAVREFLARYEP